MNTETNEPLDATQRARVAAMKAARSILEERGFASSKIVDPSWLMTVAGWILTGWQEDLDNDGEEAPTETTTEVRTPFEFAPAELRATISVGAIWTGDDEQVPVIRLKVKPSEVEDARRQRIDCAVDGIDVPTILDVLADAGDEVDDYPTIVVPVNLWGHRTKVVAYPAGGREALVCARCNLNSGDARSWTMASVWAWIHADEHYDDNPTRPVGWTFSPANGWRAE